MKKKLICTIFSVSLFISGIFAQISNGTYTNKAGQNLVISNLNNSGFHFNVTWGANDEWECQFSAEGDATLQSANFAFYGEDADMADIGFEINGNNIVIAGGYEFVGSDCAKFGESSSETYTVFTIGGSESDDVSEEFDGPEPLGKSDATGYSYFENFDGNCYSSEKGGQLRIAIYGTDTFVGYLSYSVTYDDGTESVVTEYLLCEAGMYGENLDIKSWMEIEGYSEEEPALEKISLNYEKFVIYKGVKYNLTKCD